MQAPGPSVNFSRAQVQLLPPLCLVRLAQPAAPRPFRGLLHVSSVTYWAFIAPSSYCPLAGWALPPQWPLSLQWLVCRVLFLRGGYKMPPTVSYCLLLPSGERCVQLAVPRSRLFNVAGVSVVPGDSPDVAARLAEKEEREASRFRTYYLLHSEGVGTGVGAQREWVNSFSAPSVPPPHEFRGFGGI